MGGARDKHPLALQVHDVVNVLALPVLAGLCVAALLGHFNTAQVTNYFILYVLADFLWILVQPSTLPSLHSVILGHHVVTILLLTFPLRHPNFAHFTCWDGLTELNTFFLVARRQFPSHFRLLHAAYWVSFVPLRLVLYPVLLVRFWVVLEGFPLWERLLVVGCQLLLCLFNFGMLWVSIRRRMQKLPSSQKEVEALRAASVGDISRCTDRNGLMPGRPKAQ